MQYPVAIHHFFFDGGGGAPILKIIKLLICYPFIPPHIGPLRGGSEELTYQIRYEGFQM